MSPKERKPGELYPNGGMLYLWFYDAQGVRRFGSTGHRVGEEAKAREVLEAVLAEVQRQVRKDVIVPDGTTQSYGERWGSARIARGVSDAKNELARLRLHAWPEIGHLQLEDVRPRHIKELILKLRQKERADAKAGEPLAPRTVRHVFGSLHAMFQESIVDELRESNPCVLPEGVLPKKQDKDPEWRATAVFARDEAELIISDERIPLWRRVYSAILLLAGLRTSEASALPWRAYEPDMKPLGRLLIFAAYDTHAKRVKGTKTGVTRQVPAHPTLAKVLADWKLHGWREHVGRVPGPDDLIVPKYDGSHRDAHHVHHFWKQDIATLGLRYRRQYDTRRTFISLALADGARRDILERITHGPRGDIVSLYTTLPWESLCAEVVKLRLSLLEGRVVQLRQVANSSCEAVVTPTDEPQEMTMHSVVSPTGFEPVSVRPGLPVDAGDSEGIQGLGSPGPESKSPVGVATVTTVTDALAEALDSWRANQNRAALRARLAALLEALQ